MAGEPIDTAERSIIPLPIEGPLVDMTKDYYSSEFLTDFFKDEDPAEYTEAKAKALADRLNEWKEHNLEQYDNGAVVGPDSDWKADIIRSLTLADLGKFAERKIRKLKEIAGQTGRPASSMGVTLWERRQRVIKHAIMLQPAA